MCLLFQNLGGAAGGAVEHLRGAVLCSSLSGKMVARRLTTLVASGCDVGSVQTRDRRSGRMQINVVRSDGFEASEVQPTYKATWEAFSRVVSSVPKEQLPTHIKLVRDAVSTARDKELWRKKVLLGSSYIYDVHV